MELRRMRDDDICLIESWLKQEYIAKWFGDYMDWMNEINGRHKEYSFIHHFVVEEENQPIVFCQYYDYCMLPLDDIDLKEPKGTYGIDYMIGDEKRLGKGIGKYLVGLICDKILEENDDVVQIVADPTIEEEKTNNASIKVLEANQFYYDQKSQLYKKIITD